MHLAFALFRVGKAPAKDTGPVTISSVVWIRFSQIELADATDPISVIPKTLVVGRARTRQKA